MNILLIEDEHRLADAIKSQLAKEGYIIDVCYSGEEGLMTVLSWGFHYDLAIIDRMLPVVDGLTIIKAMREKQILVPIIIITGMSELDDKIEGLDNGADDYLVKPFHIRELSARIRALTRRPIQTQNNETLVFGDLTLDTAKQELTCKNKKLTLTPKEFHVLCAFMNTPETIFTREQLLQKAWDSTAEIENGNVDNYIYFLRKRLKSLNSTVALRSVYGSGYILETPND